MVIFFGIFLILATPSQGSARAVSAIIGGGCEEPDPKAKPDPRNEGAEKTGPYRGFYNRFKNRFINTHQSLTARSWQNYIFYDTDKWAKPTPGSRPFTRQDFTNWLKELNLGKGDRLLLDIKTHGSSPDPEHEICLGDGTVMPISELKKALEPLASKGISIMVMDESCYSGSTARAFAGTQICAVGATNPGTPSRGTLLSDAMINLGASSGRRRDRPVDLKMLDSDCNGSVSGSEAFLFALLGFGEERFLSGADPLIPRSSECDWDTELRQIADQADQDFDDRRSTYQNLDSLVRGISMRLKSVDAETQATWNELSQKLTEQFMSNQSESPQNQMRSLERSLSVIRERSLEHRPLQTQADEFLAKGAPLPPALVSRINSGESAIEEHRMQMGVYLRRFLALFCFDSKRKASGSAASPCDSFGLFRVPGSVCVPRSHPRSAPGSGGTSLVR